MALTEDGCARMIEAAQKNKRTLMIGQVLRFWPEYMALQEFSASKKYGALRSATFVRQCGCPIGVSGCRLNHGVAERRSIF